MSTVFISYSWDSADHKAWVRRFAEDLRVRGIKVWLDQFDLRLGDSITAFMERAVSEADYVLLICTANFGRKANERHGGVGYEQAIVTSELLDSNPARGRFVCILRQGAPSQSLPIYMRSRLWLDCRDDSAYARALDQVVEHVMGEHDVASSIQPAVASETNSTPTYEAPRSWVLVAGTGVKRGFSSEIEALSRRLGELLMKARCGLVTGGWAGVDEWVARSFADSAHKLGAPLEDALVQAIPKSAEPAFAAGQLIFVNSGDEEWEAPIQRADVVILLGGVGGTKETGRRALRLHKPVLPIADTGGDAKAMYLEMLKGWNTLGWMGFSEREFQALGRPAHAAIDAAIELAQKLKQAK